MRCSLWLVALGIVACSRTSETTPEPTTAPTPAVGIASAAAEPTSASGSDTSGAAAPSAPSAAGAKDCVAECVASRQMEAVAIEQIEASCRTQCSEK